MTHMIRPYYRPFARNFITALSQWKCLLLTLLIDICIISMFWCIFLVEPSEKQSFRMPLCHYDYLYIPSAFFILFYLIYLIECWKCQLRLQLSHPIDVQSAYTYISQLKSNKPELFWKVSCFHYVRSTSYPAQISINTNSAGRNSQFNYEKVISEMCCGKFKMRNLWIVDNAPEAGDLENFTLTKLHLRKHLSFQNNAIEEVYNSEKKMFLQPFQYKDDFIEVVDGIETYNKSKCSTLLVTNHINRQPFIISTKLQVLCALTLMSWPLRLIIICKTAHLHFPCTKTIEPKIGNTPDESATSNEDINNLPPSYSEALRLCHSEDRDKSVIFCNKNLLSRTKYQNISSDGSTYSLEIDPETRHRRSRVYERRRSLSQYVNGFLTSARKIADSYACVREGLRRSWTLSQSNVTGNKIDIKRDMSMPIDILCPEII